MSERSHAFQPVPPTPAVVDVEVRQDGSITQFFLNTSDAQEWVSDNVQTEGWQWLGTALCVESRFARDLVLWMEADGLEVR